MKVTAAYYYAAQTPLRVCLLRTLFGENSLLKTADNYFKQRGVFYTSLDEIGLRAKSALIHSFEVYERAT